MTNCSLLTDVKPTILTLEWPFGVRPSEFRNFESEARRLRYKALGRACHHQGIHHLFLAHHEDDQAETILTRLAHGHGHVGLRGIHLVGDIPECWGMYGVHRSGGSLQSRQEPAAYQRNDNNRGFVFPTVRQEAGGITIHRPLLSFSKERLRATCRSTGIVWVEDQTNFDPTLTPRNAARKLLSSGDLPKALQKPSLLQLTQCSVEQVEKWQFRARHLHEQCTVSLDTRSSILRLHIPSRLTGEDSGSVLAQNPREISAIGLFLRRLAEMVSPLDKVPLSNILKAIGQIFSAHNGRPASPFTAGHVIFQPAQLRRARTQADTSKSNETGLWILARQPYNSSEPRPIITIDPCNPALAVTSASKEGEPPFHLWDGRYWVRVYNNTDNTLCVRPLRKGELTPFLAVLTAGHRGRLRRLIHDIAPGDVRWTLPVIALSEDGAQAGSSEGPILALPSLDIVRPDWKGKVSWEIRYKKIDPSLLPMEP